MIEGTGARRCAAALFILGATSLEGCVDAGVDRIQISADVTDISLAVQEEALVTVLTGTFDMTIAVGDLAGDQSTVEDPPSFSLVDVDDQRLVRVIDAVPSGTEFPLTLSQGQAIDLTFTLTDENLFPGEGRSVVCDAGEVQLVGSFRDTLSGGQSTEFRSAPVLVDGCDPVAN